MQDVRTRRGFLAQDDREQGARPLRRVVIGTGIDVGDRMDRRVRG